MTALKYTESVIVVRKAAQTLCMELDRLRSSLMRSMFPTVTNGPLRR